MTHSPPESEWSARLAGMIANEVRRYRKREGMTAQQLSEACAAIGMEIPRSVIANLESGRRAAVSVAELLVLAAALRVAPAQLIFPVGYEKQVEGLPGVLCDPLRLNLWMSGDGHLRDDDDDTEEIPPESLLSMAREAVFSVEMYTVAFDRYVEALQKSTKAVQALNDVDKQRVELERGETNLANEKVGAVGDGLSAPESRELLEMREKAARAEELMRLHLFSHQNYSIAEEGLRIREADFREAIIDARSKMRAIEQSDWVIPDDFKEGVGRLFDDLYEDDQIVIARIQGKVS